MKTLLIANRGEIAIRIAQSAKGRGLNTASIYAEDDRDSGHRRCTDQAIALPGSGSSAYLDIPAIIAAAKSAKADALHPGYGFLSESAELAEACAAVGITFVGPSPEVLRRTGDKIVARQLAAELGVALATGSDDIATLEDAKALLAQCTDGIMIKARSGGGGRGMRAVQDPTKLAAAWQRCASEAAQAFGDDSLYVEQLLPPARHIEVQLLGDGKSVVTMGERDCSLQRRHQKLIEIAPAPGLAPAMQQQLQDWAKLLGQHLALQGLATVEFLVWNDSKSAAFIEINPRLQVEHTVTECVYNRDLVDCQLALAAGSSLADIGLQNSPQSSGTAIQLRICASASAENNTLQHWQFPNGHGVRVDHCLTLGMMPSPNYDPLLAKLICHHPGTDWGKALNSCRRQLSQVSMPGIATNLAELERILALPELASNQFDTRFLEALGSADIISDEASVSISEHPDQQTLRSGLQGRVLECHVEPGTRFSAGEELLVIDSMKLEHSIRVPLGGLITDLHIAAGDIVQNGSALLSFTASGNDQRKASDALPDPSLIRADLQELMDLQALGADENRVEALARLHQRGKQSARTNITQLTVGGDFLEYGALAIAAQRGRRSLEDLQKRTPADGLICGVGNVNADHFNHEQTRTAIMAYDYSVLAGTQGFFNHMKTDRLVEVIEKAPMPLVMFAEGGGGRPGDVDASAINTTGLSCTSFGNVASLNGRVPMIGVNAGYCFAGNAAFLALNDIVIATRESWLGMGGPAMIEGGGLGRVDKNDIGPSAVQSRNGSIDILVENEQEAVATARRCLAYFQGPLAESSSEDQRMLRHLVPENRNRAFDVHRIIQTLADRSSVTELRREFAPGLVTALARVDGRPLGILANHNGHLSGAIDAQGAAKAERFMRLCQQSGLPLLFLVDCPGLMVGPEHDARGTARAAGDLFITASRLSVPTGAIILRKAYGLGAMAAMGGSSRSARFCVAWPTGECGPMGIEGAIRLGFKKEFEAIANTDDRDRAFKQKVEQAWRETRAINGASTVEIDAVIDPADSRRWIQGLL